MNQTIYIPKIAVVLICGPSCSGKSTLANKIIDTCPGDNKKLVSADDLLERYADLRPANAERIRRSIAKNGGALRDPEYEKYASIVFFDAVSHKNLVVSEGIYVEPEMVNSQIFATARIRGAISPFILIKMNPSRQQHLKFYNARSADRKLAWPIIEDDIKHFQGVLNTDYSRIFSWVQEYTVSDPGKAKVQFLG